MSTITDVRSSNKKARTLWARGLTLTVSLCAAALTFFASRDAYAVTCASLNTATPPATNVIYGQGGSATKPLIAKFATALRNASSPITVVYSTVSACTSINNLIGTGGVPSNISGSVIYWDAAGAEQPCDLPAAGDVGVPVGFAAMGNTAPSCPGSPALPGDITDVTGPVNAYDLIVPVGSSQTVISAEAAYLAFGLGQAGQAAPWTDDTQLGVRDPNSAAQIFISLATGVPAAKFKGTDTKSNTGTLSFIQNASKPEAALGLISGEVADANRSSIRILAYQHKGQRCGFLPDSSITSFDKKNVRNGQYQIWGPVHFFTKVDAAKKIIDPSIATFLGLFSGTTTVDAIDPVDLEIQSKNIPRCAMNVWRETDLGPISKNVPAEPCNCYFDKVATGVTSCASCTDDTACPASAPKCRRNFCEVR